MCVITIINKKDDLSYTELFFVELTNNISIKDIEEILDYTKKGKILKVDKTKENINACKLYEFISPEDVFIAIQEGNFLSSMKMINYLIENWINIYEDNSGMRLYLERLGEFFKPLL
jgi:hypothetical protein